ncbi:hypothetical protein Pfo_001336 [Paulownia fortunei]|nr:hypothetical protein Pfo_001336 [Paulownia fortunei]
MHKIIELHQCRIPPTGEVTEILLLLTHFDMEWLHFHPLHRVLFYEFPCSVTHFTNTIVPNLKKSLSLTLKHYFPLAGNLVYPLSSGMPVLRYRVGDSVSLTIAESNRVSDFYNLSGHQTREADEFYACVPQLPSAITESGSKIIPLLALQVTLFPETGMCIGITSNHVVGDASSISDFIKAWGWSTKFGGDEQFLAGKSKPFFDRSVIKDPSGLAIKRWNHMKMRKIESPPSRFSIPTNRVRATYVLTRDDIKKLKNFVLDRRPNLVHLSSFTVASSLMWTCLVKSEAACGERIDDGEPEYFCFPADARSRCNPPLPPTYFGNCLASGFLVESTHGQLKGNEGFLIAAELIGELIRKKVNNREEIFRGAEEWLSKYEALAGKRIFGVAESSKFDIYDADYGWGRPMKFESVSIDGDRYSMSLVKSRDFEGGLEIGLSLPMILMDAFAGFFADGLKK